MEIRLRARVYGSGVFYVITFKDGSGELLRLKIEDTEGARPKVVSGDGSWFDLDFRPVTESEPEGLDPAKDPRGWATAWLNPTVPSPVR